MLNRTILAAALLAATASGALAHATLEKGEASVGASYKAVIRVPHGCDGKPTIAVRVRLPEGFIAAKPQPKAGWTLEKTRGAYAKTYQYHGTPLSEGLTEVAWTGGSLADDEYDEFVVRGTLSGDLPVGETLYFLTVQDCPDGAAERWIEIPAAGQSGDDLEMPAPGLKLLERAGGH